MPRPKIVLGLGNPGNRYRTTRHNLGFRVLDLLAARSAVSFALAFETGGMAWAASVPDPSGRVVLAKPRTFMNRSGPAAVALCEIHDAVPAELLVVYDDADLDLGRVRLRPRGGAGGHNGIRSIIDEFESDRFPRIRLGVGGADRGETELADYVLSPFEPDEEPVAETLTGVGADAVEAVLERGLERAMNSYNARFVSGDDPPDRSEEEG